MSIKFNGEFVARQIKYMFSKHLILILESMLWGLSYFFQTIHSICLTVSGFIDYKIFIVSHKLLA